MGTRNLRSRATRPPPSWAPWSASARPWRGNAAGWTRPVSGRSSPRRRSRWAGCSSTWRASKTRRPRRPHPRVGGRAHRRRSAGLTTHPTGPLTQPAACSHSRPTRCVEPRALCERWKRSHAQMRVRLWLALSDSPSTGLVLPDCTAGRLCARKTGLLCSAVTPGRCRGGHAHANRRPLAQRPAPPPPSRSRASGGLGQAPGGRT